MRQRQSETTNLRVSIVLNKNQTNLQFVCGKIILVEQDQISTSKRLQCSPRHPKMHRDPDASQRIKNVSFLSKLSYVGESHEGPKIVYWYRRQKEPSNLDPSTVEYSVNTPCQQARHVHLRMLPSGPPSLERQSSASARRKQRFVTDDKVSVAHAALADRDR